MGRRPLKILIRFDRFIDHIVEHFIYITRFTLKGTERNTRGGIRWITVFRSQKKLLGNL